MLKVNCVKCNTEIEHPKGAGSYWCAKCQVHVFFEKTKGEIHHGK